MIEIELIPSKPNLNAAFLRIYSGSFNVRERVLSFRWDICNTLMEVLDKGEFVIKDTPLNIWLRVPVKTQERRLIELISAHLMVSPKYESEIT